MAGSRTYVGPAYYDSRQLVTFILFTEAAMIAEACLVAICVPASSTLVVHEYEERKDIVL